MRLQELTAFAALALAFAMAATGCNTTQQLGGACGTDTEPVEGEIVEGEDAVDEIVRIERDGVCESFQCLTEGGLAPYCTDTCTYDSDSSNTSCVSDSDCSRKEEHCIEDQCRADDCQDGFTCRQVQETGPLADKRYCARQTGCLTNFDCGDVGSLRCEILVCVDACLLIGGDCDTHYLTCQPREDVPYCLCNGEAAASNSTYCEAEALECQPPNGDAFPEDAAELRGVCVGIDQTVNNPLPTASGT